jgi:hypothetical protein
MLLGLFEAMGLYQQESEQVIRFSIMFQRGLSHKKNRA